MTTVQYCSLVPFCHWNSEEFVSNSSCIPTPNLDLLLEFIYKVQQPLRLGVVYDTPPAPAVTVVEHTCSYRCYLNFKRILYHLCLAAVANGIKSLIVWIVRKILNKPGVEEKRVRELEAQRVLMEQILAEQKELKLENEEILCGRNLSPRTL